MRSSAGRLEFTPDVGSRPIEMLRVRPVSWGELRKSPHVRFQTGRIDAPPEHCLRSSARRLRNGRRESHREKEHAKRSSAGNPGNLTENGFADWDRHARQCPLTATELASGYSWHSPKQRLSQGPGTDGLRPCDAIDFEAQCCFFGMGLT
jgi:hypothetical protein